jgi:hypothetical protein
MMGFFKEKNALPVLFEVGICDRFISEHWILRLTFLCSLLGQACFVSISDFGDLIRSGNLGEQCAPKMSEPGEEWTRSRESHVGGAETDEHIAMTHRRHR